MLAASALAANMFMRSILAAAFPLFASYCKWLSNTLSKMYRNLIAAAVFHNLGLDWGMSLLGFLSTAMIPIPFL